MWDRELLRVEDSGGTVRVGSFLSRPCLSNPYGPAGCKSYSSETSRTIPQLDKSPTPVSSNPHEWRPIDSLGVQNGHILDRVHTAGPCHRMSLTVVNSGFRHDVSSGGGARKFLYLFFRSSYQISKWRNQNPP